MGVSKTEVNLNRLLAAAARQQNQAKLIHVFGGLLSSHAIFVHLKLQYVAALRELHEKLGVESTSEGVTSISKTKLNDYSQKIEALATQLSAPLLPELEETVDKKTSLEEESPLGKQAALIEDSSQGLRRRAVHSVSDERTHEMKENNQFTHVKLDDAAQARIERHRKLQEDLTDEMVILAQQLKESSLLMNNYLHETEKVLDSTESAMEHSLASTGRANARAMEIYSDSAKTSCFTWLVIFLMTCVFVMVVLLIRVT